MTAQANTAQTIEALTAQIASAEPDAQYLTLLKIPFGEMKGIELFGETASIYALLEERGYRPKACYYGVSAVAPLGYLGYISVPNPNYDPGHRRQAAISHILSNAS